MRRRTVTVLAGFAVLVALGVVASSALAGWLYWNRVEMRGEQTTRAELAPLAKDQIPEVFGYDYQTVERSLDEAAQLLTPQYRNEFEDRTKEEIIPQAREREVVSQVNVVGAGVLSAQRNSGSVMVYMNRTVTDKSQESVYDGSRLRVDYEKIDGEWLIDYIIPM